MGESVGKWVFEQAKNRTDAKFELIDIRDYNLPLLDEPVSAGMSSDYKNEHTKKWSAKISSLDAFIFVSPEYNHGTSAALKNALDYLYEEWNDKVAGLVAYGSAGGTRAVEQLRLNLAELQVATVRTQVSFSLRTDFEKFSIFKPADNHKKVLNTVIDQVIKWGEALEQVRSDVTENIGTAGTDDQEQAPLH